MNHQNQSQVSRVFVVLYDGNKNLFHYLMLHFIHYRGYFWLLKIEFLFSVQMHFFRLISIRLDSGFLRLQNVKHISIFNF